MKHQFVNKTTGCVGSVMVITFDAEDDNRIQNYSYEYVEDLMEEWAAYEPYEPMVKDKGAKEEKVIDLSDSKKVQDGPRCWEYTYNIAEQVIKEIANQKESLYKHFCKDVCEKMVAYYYEDSVDILQFHKVFNEKFDEVVKEWDDTQST